LIHPSTSGFPLSDARVERFKHEARDTFQRSCIARLILTEVDTEVGVESEGEFRKIGVNHIVDRIWFVDGVFGDSVYNTPSGAQYGIAVAEWESRLVLEKLFTVAMDKAEQCVTAIAGDPEEAEVHKILDKLESGGNGSTGILANIDQGIRFWDFKSFTPSHDVRRGLMSPEGTFRGVPVFHSRLLPDGVIISVDREELGTLEVKKDFTIRVSDIQDPQDRELVRKALPDLVDAELDEKVCVLCYEIVKSTLKLEPSMACQIIARKGTKLQLRTLE